MDGYTHSDLGLVRTFEAVASSKSFSNAARLLGVSQSTISEHVRLLEEKVDAKLLNRTTRSISLTPAGEVMQIYAQSLLRVSEQIGRHFNHASKHNQLRLGVTEDIASSRFSSLLRLFLVDFPNSELAVRTGSTVELLQMLEAQKLDVVIGERRAQEHGGRLLWRSAATWVAHGEVVLSPSQPVPLLMMVAPSLLRSIALEALAAQNRSYRIVFECNSFTALRSAFEIGSGITVGLTNYLPDFVQPIVNDLSLPKLPSVEVFVDHQSAQLSPSAEVFAAFVEEALVRLHCASETQS